MLSALLLALASSLPATPQAEPRFEFKVQEGQSRAPIAGARVFVLPRSMVTRIRASPEEVPRETAGMLHLLSVIGRPATTDPNGIALLRGHQPPMMLLVTTQDGRVASKLVTKKTNGQLRVAVRERFRVGVRVVDQDGHAVQGAWVQWSSRDLPLRRFLPMSRAQTDERGVAQLIATAEDWKWLRSRPSHLVELAIPMGNRPSLRVELSGPSPQTLPSLVMPESTSLTVAVTDTHDAMHPGETAGVLVSMPAPLGEAAPAEFRWADGGKAVLDHVPVGQEFHITLVHPGVSPYVQKPAFVTVANDPGRR